MAIALKFVSLVGLALTIIPAVLVLIGNLKWETHSQLMFVGMCLWFVSAPFWMKRDK